MFERSGGLRFVLTFIACVDRTACCSSHEECSAYSVKRYPVAQQNCRLHRPLALALNFLHNVSARNGSTSNIFYPIYGRSSQFPSNIVNSSARYPLNLRNINTTEMADQQQPPCRILIMASGNGTNFEALIKAVATGRIPNSQISRLIVNRSKAYATTRADQAGITDLSS